MKKNALLSSVLTVILCLSLIAGSTFALFTSDTFVTIEVDAGRVNIKAGLTAPVLYSVVPDANGSEFDENGKPYSYELQQVNFANGGTASLDADNGIISLVNVTPGDKIEFSLNGENTSDVAVQYRYKLEVVDGHNLMSGFIVTVNGVKYASLASYVSDWNDLAVDDDITEVKLALELPVSAGNEFQELTAKVKLSVEAVQANADVTDTDAVTVKYITTVNDSAELASKLASEDYLHVFLNKDINDTLNVNFDMKDKTIDAAGHNVALNFGSGDKDNPITLENVVIKNIVDTPDETPAVVITSSAKGDVTITDSVLYNGSKTPYGSVAASGSAPTLDLTVERCKLFSGIGDTDANGNPVYGEKYGIYGTNINNLTVRDTEFTGFGSWAIIINGTTTGNIVISGCTFTDCAGIFKTSVAGGENWQTGSLNGNMTFANNKLVNCTMKDGKYISVTNLYGTLTFSNNTLNGVIATVEDMKGIVLP